MAGKGKSEGGLSGSVRNPDLYCSRPGCKKYRVKGTTICTSHGAGRAIAKKRAASTELEKAAAKPLAPKDWPGAVAELVGWHLTMVRDLQQELDGLSLIGSPVEMAREYSDILDRLDKSSASVSKLLGSIAALGIADAFKQQANAMTNAEREDRVNRLLTLTLEAEGTGQMWECPTCGRACCSVAEDAVVAEG